MSRAILLRDYRDENSNPHHRLYRCEGGELPEFVIVSVFEHKNRTGARISEARILPATPEGRVMGNFEGLGDEDTADHGEALRRHGYEVAS